MTKILNKHWVYQYSAIRGCYCLLSVKGDLRELRQLNIVKFKQFSNGKLIIIVRGDKYGL